MAAESDSPAPVPRRQPLRHWLGFLVSGGVAFSVDAAVLELLVLEGVHPMVARLAAISLAMVAGWLMHRTVTFAVSAPPSVPEFLRYAGVAWTAAAVNYGSFALIMLERPATRPVVALVAASIVATVFAYLGMRLGAFRQRHLPADGPGTGAPPPHTR